MASYYVWSGATGSANGTTWANAYTTLTTAFSGKVAGDTFYVAHDHAETTASTVVLTTAGTIVNPSKVICVNRAGTVPPVSADRRTTASVTCSGFANDIRLNGFTHYDGIIFNGGASSNAANIQIPNGTNNVHIRLDNCSLRLTNTATGSIIGLGGGTVGAAIDLNNTTVSFAHASQQIYINGGAVTWRNTPSALLGTMPTVLFKPEASRGGILECSGVDFSASSGTIAGSASSANYPQSWRFVDCKLHASATKSQVPTLEGTTYVDFIRTGATAANYTVQRHRISALLTEETTIVRTTGGASDGTTPLSWKVVTTADANFVLPFECPPIAIWNDTVGSAKTATIECIGTAVATDQEVWLDLEYLGDASSPQGSFVNDGMADLLTTAANQTTSSATWGGALTGKFKLAVTFTPQMKGWVYCRVKVGKASSTFYIDPLVTLS